MKTSMLALSIILGCALFFYPARAGAHCDTMDGPVVQDARMALEKGDVTPVLKWVSEKNEPEIKSLFAQTLLLRKKDPQVQELADTYFFETLVRIHRAGEGEPYTGLKPAGTEIEAGIQLADRALDTGSADALIRQITGEIESGIRHRFEMAAAARKTVNTSVAAGREYVEAYVTYLHYVERLHEDTVSAPGH